MKKILVTGAGGFIGKNLLAALKERNLQVITHLHSDAIELLEDKVKNADFIYHLAGVNRPLKNNEFVTSNIDFTQTLIDCIGKVNKGIAVVYSSSIQAQLDNPYGQSKRRAEELLAQAEEVGLVKSYIYRLPGVFGKWCRPNYNSVVATFCHNIINQIPLHIDNPAHQLELVYIDDVVSAFISHLSESDSETGFKKIAVTYTITLQELADRLQLFHSSRSTLVTESVGVGLSRALYATYLSYLDPARFSYSVPVYKDDRGVFSEILKTPEHGQFSFFTAKPGVTRGGHYHHSKNEKFVVLQGKALFKFENIITGEIYETVKTAVEIEVVETVPGWAHNIKNIGEDDLIVMLWANEIFDRDKPDTFSWSM
ncbi:MAG: NAD-dependent epimerase/dehydratase family protein [Mixta calida]|uniref:UDP-2-acetamido-2,6-beta-L-arabino-hexul-4-ose reductase n=1 Tax=Mixta calida TaxID=665913 RepID=UPI002908BF7E|nr:NAD-dependent epimerase/dehydratase family protein [Mixta calida]MDU4940943.1 NAD-dependent epimerase/dehydratase family protein [Mixta calida]